MPLSQNSAPQSLQSSCLPGWNDKAKSQTKGYLLGQNMEGMWLSVFWSIIITSESTTREEAGQCE